MSEYNMIETKVAKMGYGWHASYFPFYVSYSDTYCINQNTLAIVNVSSQIVIYPNNIFRIYQKRNCDNTKFHLFKYATRCNKEKCHLSNHESEVCPKSIYVNIRQYLSKHKMHVEPYEPWATYRLGYRFTF